MFYFRSLSNQKEYERYLKNAFNKADDNKSGYLNFEEVYLKGLQSV